MERATTITNSQGRGGKPGSTFCPKSQLYDSPPNLNFFINFSAVKWSLIEVYRLKFADNVVFVKGRDCYCVTSCKDRKGFPADLEIRSHVDKLMFRHFPKDKESHHKWECMIRESFDNAIFFLLFITL